MRSKASKVGILSETKDTSTFLFLYPLFGILSEGKEGTLKASHTKEKSCYLFFCMLFVSLIFDFNKQKIQRYLVFYAFKIKDFNKQGIQAEHTSIFLSLVS